MWILHVKASDIFIRIFLSTAGFLAFLTSQEAEIVTMFESEKVCQACGFGLAVETNTAHCHNSTLLLVT